MSLLCHNTVAHNLWLFQFFGAESAIADAAIANGAITHGIYDYSLPINDTHLTYTSYRQW
jgi:hypothetical protein